MTKRPLTPYVETLYEALEGAVRDLLGAEVRVERGHGDGLRYVVRVDSVPIVIELAEGGPAFLRRGPLAISYRNDGGDPMVRPAARAFLESLRSLEPERVERVLAAARAAWPFARVDDRLFRYVAPREAMIRLGFRCNQDCDFCWQGRRWPEPPIELYERWVDEMEGVRVLHFSGGEPTIHPALPALVARAAGRGIEVRLQTNAIQLAKPGFLARVPGVTGVFVSYHSHRAEISDAMTRAPGTHARTEAGIDACLRAGIDVELNTVVDRRNVDHLGALADHVIARFPGVRAVDFSHPGIAFDPAAYSAHLAPLDVVGPALVEAMRKLGAAGVLAIVDGACGFPACTFRGAPELAPRVHGESIEDEGGFDRVFVTACDRCARRPSCVGLRRAYVDRLGDRGVVPFDRPPQV